MTTHTYTAAEIAPLDDVYDIIRRALTHGYIGVGAWHKVDADGDRFLVTIDQVDGKATTKSNLVSATVPTLALSSYNVQVAGDGVSTTNVTLSDSRGTGAAGKMVSMRVSNANLLSPSPTATLDGNGQVVLTFGPSPSAGCVFGGIKVPFFYQSGECAEIEGSFSYL